MIRDILTPQQMQKELKKLNLSQIADKYGASKQYITQLHTEYKAAYPELFPDKTLSKEWLEEAIKTQTIYSICQQTGLSYHRVRNLIRSYGLERSTVTAQFDEKQIRQMYVYEWQSDKEIADAHGCSASLVKKFRYNHGIFKTDRLPLDKRLTRQAAEYLCDELRLSLDEICEVFNSAKRETEKVLSMYSLCASPMKDNKYCRSFSVSEIRAYIRSQFVE